MITDRWGEPEVDVTKLPEAEREAAQSVNNGLFMLRSYVYNFRGALTLFDFCNDQQMKLGRQQPLNEGIKRFLDDSRLWIFMAGRDGAMTIYHFATACEGVRKAISECPTLRAAIDYNALRAAIRSVRAAFPDFDNVRDAVAHAADKGKTPLKLEEHGVSGNHAIGRGFMLENVSRVTISDGFNNRTYFNSWEGELRTYELSLESLEKLRSIKDAVWSAFRRPPAPAIPAARQP